MKRYIKIFERWFGKLLHSLGIKFVADSSDLMGLFLLLGIGLLAILICVIALAVIKKKQEQGKPVKNASPGTVFLIFGSLIAVGVYIANPSDFGVTALSVAIIALVALLIFRKRKKKKATVTNLFYDKYSKTLMLQNRTKTNKLVFSAENAPDFTVHFKPEQWVYTGVSVGGVHTGGFHKEGGYHYAKPAHTGKYVIVFDNCIDHAIVDRIRILDPKVLQLAKENAFISQFLDGDILELKHDFVHKNEAKVKAAIELQQIDVAMRFMKQDHFNTLLTKEECKKVIAWLCGEE